MIRSSSGASAPRVVAALGLLAVVAIVVVLVVRGDGVLPFGSEPEPEELWDVRVVPAGAVGGATNRQRRAIEEQEDDLSAVVAAVNDALILSTQHPSEIEGAALTDDAAQALASSPLRPAGEIDAIEPSRQSARVGVDVNGARRAIATSVVVARVETENQQVRVRYETTLWLERAGGGWRVFAFDGSRRRA